MWGFAFVLLMLGGIMVVQGLVDTDALRTQVEKTLKAKTGQEVKVGAVSIRLLPRPVAYISGLEIVNSKPQEKDIGKVRNPKPELTTDLVVLSLDMFTLLDEVPHISGVAMQRPMLVLQRGEGNFVQWGWLNKELVKSLFSPAAHAEALSLKFVEGRVAYREQNGDEFFSVESLTLEGVTGNAPTFEGEGTFGERVVQFVLDDQTGDTKLAKDATAINLALFTDSKNIAQLKGGLVFEGDKPMIEGDFTLSTEDLYPWVYPGQTAGDGATVYPFQLSGKWSQQADTVEIRDVQLQGLNSAGLGIIAFRWAGWRPDIQLDFRMKAMDYNKWESLLHDIVVGTIAESRPDGAYGMEGSTGNPLVQNFNLLLYLDVDNLIMGAQTLENTQVQAALADGALTVNQFNIQMPGQSELTLFGVVSPGGTGGLRFEGSMEMQGKSLRDMLTVFEETAKELPEASFGEFSTRSNIFISSEQLRLSEAQTKINDLTLSGGLVAYFDAQPRVEADVKLKDINFDYFRDVWRETHKEAGKGDYFLKFDRSASYNWLNKIRAAVDFKVTVDGFTFFEKEGSTANFRLFAKRGEIGLYNVRMTYPTGDLDANISMNVRKGSPEFSVVLNTDEVNTDYFLPLSEVGYETPPETGVPQKRVWSEELVNMQMLEGFNANYDLTISSLTHRGMPIKDVKFQGELSNGALNFKNTSFACWGGKCSVTGLIYGGKVPGINTSFTMYNLELKDVLRTLTGHQNISGRVSLTGTLSTTGVNYQSWAQQADANIVFSGRNVAVEGMNLRGVLDVVKVSRTAADVFNNANLALRDGVTDFSIEGSLNAKEGRVRTPGIKMTSSLASGTLNAEVNLLPWQLDSSVVFAMQTLSTENVPTLTIQVAGPLEAPVMRSDTASLEAYVAKQIVGQ